MHLQQLPLGALAGTSVKSVRGRSYRSARRRVCLPCHRTLGAGTLRGYRWRGAVAAAAKRPFMDDIRVDFMEHLHLLTDVEQT